MNNNDNNSNNNNNNNNKWGIIIIRQVEDEFQGEFGEDAATEVEAVEN